MTCPRAGDSCRSGGGGGGSGGGGGGGSGGGGARSARDGMAVKQEE